MIKRLTALTLAMLMLLNPMTAFAVQWDSILTVLQAQNSYKQSGVDIDVKDGAVTVNSGNVENFFHDSAFSSYTFKNTVTLGGEIFYVFVDKGESVTVDIESGAVVSADNGVQAAASGASITINNAGEVLNRIQVGAYHGATATVNNSGTVGGEIDGDADGEKNTLTINNNGIVNGDLDIDPDGDHGTISIDNSGTVDGEIDVDVDGKNNAITIKNSGFVIGEGDIELDLDKGSEGNRVTITNSGNLEDELDIDIDASKNTVNATNTGIIGGSMDAEIGYILDYDEYDDPIYYDGITGNSVTLTNSGDVAHDLDARIYGANENSISINNSEDIDGSLGVYIDSGVSNNVIINSKGNIAEDLYVNTYGESNSVNLNSEGDIAEDLYVYAYGEGNSVNLNSKGDIAETLYVDAYGEGNSVNLNSEGSIGEEIPEEYTDYPVANIGVYGEDNSVTVNTSGDIKGDLYATTDGHYDSENDEFIGSGGTLIVNHDGNVEGFAGSGAFNGGETSVVISGTAESATAASSEGANATLGVLGGLKDGNKFSLLGEQGSKISLLISAGNGSVLDPETVGQIIQDSIVNEEGYEYEGSLEIITTDENGNKTARYSIVDGKATLLEVYETEDSGSSYDDPAFWTAERKRHDKEEERKAAAIGGVTGSPYWVKQLYLGYMSLNLRLFDGEEQLLFKEHLSWQKDGSKLLTLRTKITDTSDLMMRLDGMVIDKLHQAGISTIAIIDGEGNPFMAYEVSDLEGARAMYKLGFEDYLVVGEATDDVMKIGADGKIVPIEGEEETAA